MNTRTPQRSDLPTSKRVGTRQDSHLADAPRLALNIKDACQALSVSWDVWKQHIEPDVRIVRIGTRKLVPVAELQRWLADHAETTLSDHA